MGIISWILGRKIAMDDSAHEPIEPVAHDIVIINGVEVTADDPEER